MGVVQVVMVPDGGHRRRRRRRGRNGRRCRRAGRHAARRLRRRLAGRGLESARGLVGGGRSFGRVCARAVGVRGLCLLVSGCSHCWVAVVLVGGWVKSVVMVMKMFQVAQVAGRRGTRID